MYRYTIVALFGSIRIHTFELSAGGVKRDVGKGLTVLAQNVSWPNDLRSRSAARRAAQDLAITNTLWYKTYSESTNV